MRIMVRHMRRVFSVLLCIFVTGAAWGAEESELFKKGRALLFNGESLKAVEVLREAIKNDPKNVEAHVAYQNAMWLNDRKALLEEYARRAEGSPEDPDAVYLNGRLIGKSGKVDEAKAWFDRCLKLKPDHHQARMARAISYSIQQQTEKATAILEELLKENPQDMRALDMKAAAAVARQDMATAQASVEVMKSIQTDVPEERLMVCDALVAIGEVDQCTRELQQLLKKYPQSPYVLVMQGQHLNMRGEFAEAEAALKKAAATEPNLDSVHWSLSGLYRQMGKGALAQEETEIYERLKQPSASIVLNRNGTILSWDANEALIHQAQGAGFLELGQLEKAEVELQKAIEKDASLIWARYNLAGVLNRLDRKKEAMDLVDDIARIPEADRWIFRYQKGSWLYESGRIADANQVWRKAMALEPKGENIRNRLRKLVTATDGVQTAKQKRLEKVQRQPCLEKNYCVPVAISTVAGFWGTKVDPLKLIDAHHGVATDQTVKLLRGQPGFSCIAFRATTEALKACIDQGMPPILWYMAIQIRPDGCGEGHDATVVGYDETRGCILTLDGTWADEEWTFYDDIRPAIAYLLVPTGTHVDTSALDVKEGESLLNISLASVQKDWTRVDSLMSEIKVATAEAALLKACSLTSRNQWKESVPLFQQVADVAKSNVALQSILGLALLHSDKPQDAIPVLKRAIELDPSSSYARYLLAGQLGQAGKIQDAFDVLEPVSKTFDVTPDALLLLGRLSFRLGKSDMVGKTLQTLEMISPENARKLKDEFAKTNPPVKQ